MTIYNLIIHQERSHSIDLHAFWYKKNSTAQHRLKYYDYCSLAKKSRLRISLLTNENGWAHHFSAHNYSILFVMQILFDSLSSIVS